MDSWRCACVVVLFSWWGQHLRDAHGFDTCVLRRRCNEFVPAGLACVVFFRVRRSVLWQVSVSLRHDGRDSILWHLCMPSRFYFELHSNRVFWWCLNAFFLQCVLCFGGFWWCVDFVARTQHSECFGGRLCGHKRVHVARSSLCLWKFVDRARLDLTGGSTQFYCAVHLHCRTVIALPIRICTHGMCRVCRICAVLLRV